MSNEDGQEPSIHAQSVPLCPPLQREEQGAMSPPVGRGEEEPSAAATAASLRLQNKDGCWRVRRRALETPPVMSAVRPMASAPGDDSPSSASVVCPGEGGHGRRRGRPRRLVRARTDLARSVTGVTGLPRARPSGLGERLSEPLQEETSTARLARRLASFQNGDGYRRVKACAGAS